MKMSAGQQKQDPGDDTVVLRVYLTWCDTAKEALESPLRGCVHRLDNGAWQLAFSVPRVKRLQRHFVEVTPDGVRADRWPMARLAPGVWDLPISVHVPGQLHAYVTLIGVPDPAPWEAK
jgi:hypothetical protein